jgi:hypothetical protein
LPSIFNTNPDFISASVGGTLRGRTSNDFPWKTLPKELARLGCRLVNYPDDTLMPGEIRPTLIRSKGIHDLTLPHRVNLVNALKMGTLTIQAMTNDTARKRLTMSWDPVIIAEAPSYRSNHSRARRVFANGDIDFRGPRRLASPPSTPSTRPSTPSNRPSTPPSRLSTSAARPPARAARPHTPAVRPHAPAARPPAPAARPAIHPTRRTQVFVEISRPPPRPASRAIPSSTARTISRPLLRSASRAVSNHTNLIPPITSVEQSASTSEYDDELHVSESEHRPAKRNRYGMTES